MDSKTINESAPIKDLVGRLGIHHAKGNHYFCPLHNENTGSFHVDERRNRWSCFGGCTSSYRTPIDLVMAVYGCSLVAAKLLLIEMYSIPDPNPYSGLERQQAARLKARLEADRIERELEMARKARTKERSNRISVAVIRYWHTLEPGTGHYKWLEGCIDRVADWNAWWSGQTEFLQGCIGVADRLAAVYVMGQNLMEID